MMLVRHPSVHPRDQRFTASGGTNFAQPFLMARGTHGGEVESTGGLLRDGSKTDGGRKAGGPSRAKKRVFAAGWLMPADGLQGSRGIRGAQGRADRNGGRGVLHRD